MTTPSTSWREDVAADETERFARYATLVTDLQKKRDAKYGPGRALHRKQLTGLAGRLEVKGNLPAWAAHGLFASPATYEVLARLSNGGVDKQRDSTGDVRGYAFSVKGVSGESALGGAATAQDFLLINHPSFSSPKSAEFIGMIQAVANGPWALIKYFVSTYGLFAGLGRVKKLKDGVDRPFTGFATERFFSAAPIACGPYACRVRLLPASSEVNAAASADWGTDMLARVRKGTLVHELQLQPFVDEKTTPIEDASVDWSESVSPYVTVAHLTLPQHTLDDVEVKRLADLAEKGVFDPWRALAAHRPLGDVMRARKVIYFASQQTRGAS